MYEAVLARPAGPSTVARLAATAADYGFAGVVVMNPPAERPAFDADAVREAVGIDVVEGATLMPADPAQASGTVGHARPSTPVLGLHGGDEALIRYAVDQDRIDVLLGTVEDDIDLTHGQVQAAADHGVRLAVELGPVLRATGERRTQAIARLRKLRELVEAYDARYVVTAGAASHLELRAPRELAAAGAVAGFERSGIERGLEEWGRLAEHNRERLGDDYVAPGVHREVDEA